MKQAATLEEAVEELKRDPLHAVRLHVAGVDVELHLVRREERPRRLGDLMAEGGGWKGRIGGRDSLLPARSAQRRRSHRAAARSLKGSPSVTRSVESGRHGERPSGLVGANLDLRRRRRRVDIDERVERVVGARIARDDHEAEKPVSRRAHLVMAVLPS